MDVAYDHIQEEALSPDEVAKKEAGEKEKNSNLNTEFQEAYKSFSASPWGAKLGGFFSDVRKQGETYYEGARQEATAASGEALKGFSDLRSTLVNRARSMSTGQSPPTSPVAAAPDTGAEKETGNKHRTDSEALRESEGVISRFKTEASKRLKDLEKAEEAADAAIFKFGANIGNFLREAVTIAPPTEETNADGSRKVLFESKDKDGKRVIHSTRFDAQLHAIHSSHDSFLKDPASPEYDKWKNEFDLDNKTDAIAADLEKYEELRRTMEKLAPERVEFPLFWTRYYFLRMVVETEEQRRREMLKGATMSSPELINWDDDSDSDQPSTPQQPGSTTPSAKSQQPQPTSASSQTSSTTIHKEKPEPTPAATTSSTTDPHSLKPAESRRSEDMHSQNGSDASYDLVSGATSRAPGSPKEARSGEKKDEDDEEDWE